MVRRFFRGGFPLLFILSLLCGGCAGDKPHDLGANQSLVEIGELSLEQGESLERQGRTAEANVAYRKALWAFRYHERLTREEPFLTDEAIEGAQRTAQTPAGGR